MTTSPVLPAVVSSAQADTKLMIPGPTPLPDSVRVALGQPAIGHRSPEFKTVLEYVYPALQRVFKTKNSVLMYSASGSGAMDAAVSNTLNAGDKVLVLVCGVFSGRWADICEAHGVDVARMDVAAGEFFTPDMLKARLAEDTHKELKAVMMIHSETSTGVLNPVKELVAEIKAHNPDTLAIVDTVTGLASAEFDFDGWGVDIAVSGSQKGFMIPPGLSFLAVSDLAMTAHEQCQHPGFYFHFAKTKKAQDASSTPWTPATHLILALHEALKMMETEGIGALTQRHQKMQQMVRTGVQALGLKLVVTDDTYASRAVTSVYPPDNVSVDAIRAGLKNDFGIVVANGQKDLKGKIFRIGHLGYMSERDVLMTLSALKVTLEKLGHSAS